jgi:hypothetical protein
MDINPLNAELNPTCHLLALLGGATIVVVSRLRVKSRHLPERSFIVKISLPLSLLFLYRAAVCGAIYKFTFSEICQLGGYETC